MRFPARSGLGHSFVPVIVGGDHSITAPAIRGFAKANPGKKIGVINFDGHMDVRNFDYGNHNGTPFRQILEREPKIDPTNFVEIGIHGFMNSSTYYKELLDQGTRVITGREVQKRGMEDCVTEALELAGRGTDIIYVSVDIDCLAYPYTIGTSAASPEGLSAWQLLEGNVALRPASEGRRARCRRDRSFARRQGSDRPLRLQRDPHLPRRTLSSCLRRSGLLISQEDAMSQLVTTGFHHVTLVCRDARQTMRFYRDLLGLAMVKVTVNFDRTDTYHLYFGNEAGAPGTLLTFFEWPAANAGALRSRWHSPCRAGHRGRRYPADVEALADRQRGARHRAV